MKKSFCIKDLIKYLIVLGIIYSILKMVPTEQLCNKDLALIIIVTTFCFISLDWLFNNDDNQMEQFSNLKPKEPALETRHTTLHNNNSNVKLNPHTTYPQTTQPMQQPTTQQIMQQQMIDQQIMQQQQPMHQQPMQQKPTQQQIMQQQIMQQLHKPLTQQEINQMQEAYPMTGKSACSDEIERLKKQLEAQISALNNKLQNQNIVTNDFKYNQMDIEMLAPIGEGPAFDWSTDNTYTILNTNQWQVPMPRPPVCINTQPCKVCPSEESSYGPLPLKNFNSAQKLSNYDINQKWAKDHT